MATVTALRPCLDIELSPTFEAHEPPEARGLRRDQVRMMVADADGKVGHTSAEGLVERLVADDLLVVNRSATLPAALTGSLSGRELAVHLATPLPGGIWLVEPRTLREDGLTEPFAVVAPGDRIDLPGGGSTALLAPFSGDGQRSRRLWLASLELPAGVEDYLSRHGRPIRYAHVPREWPLAAYQTVFATEPGSAELPSAGRPFSNRLVSRLVSRGIGFAPIVLHTGVSSLEGHEPPYPERYRVPAATARRINETRAAGGRVIAVGTTVVRALETVVDDTGAVHPGEGFTDLEITVGRGISSVDGMLTGWHEPCSSHLRLLEALAGRDLIERSYHAAVDRGYLWHEFGDLHLILRS